MVLGILVFVTGIFVMILVHELGHFIAARRFGIKIEEFFIGFGPRLWSFRRGDTEYGVKALLLGGYVRIAGMDPMEEPRPEDRDRVFTAKPKWQRAVVLGAGSFTHFVLAFVTLLVILMAIGIQRFGGPQVQDVEPVLDGRPSPAAAAGMEPGDVFVSMNGRPVADYEAFVREIDRSVGREMTFVVERDGRRVTLRATPVSSVVDGERIGRLGITVGQEYLGRERSGPIEGIRLTGEIMGEMIVGSFQAMGRVFGPEGIGRIASTIAGERPRTIEDPAGLVGAARVSGEAAAAGRFDALLSLFAFFNVFVGILNILPLPPLDGGHLAVLGVEALTKRRIDPRRLLPITAVVVMFLMLFFFSLLYLDLVSPIPNPFQ